jgi:hypothetical protein
MEIMGNKKPVYQNQKYAGTFSFIPLRVNEKYSRH